MTISYHWEDMTVNVECCGRISPHTRPRTQDVDYDYDVNVSEQDIVDYLMPMNLSKRNKNKSEEEIKEAVLASFYMEKMYDFLRYNDAIDLDALEQDESFVEFMKERYEEKAMEEWERYNDAY